MSAIDDLLTRMRAEREAALTRIKALDRAITSLESARAALPPEMLEASVKMTFTAPLNEPQRLRGVLPPLEVAMAAREAILGVGRPLKRGQIVRELEKRNVPLAGKDKNKNLGTILWRHEDLFVSIPKLGYWPKNVPLKGLYDPEA